MASTRDVKDIMGLAAPNGAAPGAPVQKKPKPMAPKRLTGINREVLALHGDRAPPISIIEPSKNFRAKVKRDFKPSRWDFATFTNEARRDDLQLRHWKKQKIERPAVPASDAMDTETVEPAYSFAKYNVSINVPEYDDDKYNAHLRSNDWSREETDYLIGLVKEYAQKWPIIIDRYEWPPANSVEDELALARPRDARSLEALKARYYQVWAKCLEVEHGGQAGMNEAEFALFETLTKYDPRKELDRKELGWRLFERPLEEIREEEYLLAELQRIMINAQKFEQERAEVRTRLTAPTSTNGNHVPTSFAELNELFNKLSQADRNRRARGRLSMDASGGNQSAGGMSQTPLSATHRDSIVSTSGQKKGNMSTAQPVRQLDPRAEKRFGVTTHDRLTSGVTFRADKIIKMRQAKSQIQTQKIAQALVELGVPDILPVPTQRVLDAFEGVVKKVQRLVDARKVVEKEEAEARVQGGLRKELQKENGEEGGEENGEKEAEVEEEEEEEEEEQKDDEAEADEEGSQANGDDEEDGEGEDDDAEAGEDEEFDAEGQEEDDAEGEDDDADGEEDEPEEMDVDED